MVKKGGMKRKIEIKPIKTKTSLAPTYTKRREGLFSKAAQLCLLSGAQVAVLATPSSSESNVSFYSFGHSSVDGVVSAFLSGQRPVPDDDKAMKEDVAICLTRQNLGLGFWWNDVTSEDPREISDAIDSMCTLLGNLKKLRADQASFVNNNNHQAFVNDDHDDLNNNEKSNFILDGATDQEPDQTLNHLQSSICTTSPIICCIPPPHAIDDQSTCPDYDSLIADTVFTDDLPADIIKQYQICESFCVTDNNNYNSFTDQVNSDFDQELDIDQLIDFDTDFESSLDNWFTHQEIGLNLDQCFPYIS